MYGTQCLLFMVHNAYCLWYTMPIVYVHAVLRKPNVEFRTPERNLHIFLHTEYMCIQSSRCPIRLTRASSKLYTHACSRGDKCFITQQIDCLATGLLAGCWICCKLLSRVTTGVRTCIWQHTRNNIYELVCDETVYVCSDSYNCYGMFRSAYNPGCLFIISR